MVEERDQRSLNGEYIYWAIVQDSDAGWQFTFRSNNEENENVNNLLDAIHLLAATVVYL